MTSELIALVRETVRAVTIIVAAAILMLGLLAVAHDGQIADAIASSLEGAIAWGLPVIGAIITASQFASAISNRTSSSTAPQEGGDHGVLPRSD